MSITNGRSFMPRSKSKVVSYKEPGGAVKGIWEGSWKPRRAGSTLFSGRYVPPDPRKYTREVPLPYLGAPVYRLVRLGGVRPLHVFDEFGFVDVMLLSDSIQFFNLFLGKHRVIGGRLRRGGQTWEGANGLCRLALEADPGLRPE